MKKIVLPASILLNIVLACYILRAHIFPVKQTNKTSVYFTNRNKVLDSLPVDDSSIIFGGDSHIQNFELSEIFKSLEFKNRGISYDTSLGLLNRIDELTNGHPAKVFIEIGTNDLMQNVPLKNIENNIKAILVKIKTQSAGTKIFLQSVLPYEKTWQNGETLNNRLKFMADSMQVTFIDLSPYFLDKGLKKQYDSGDGVHLNSKGYYKWRDILKKYL
jgi:lysophospholipase L1-like esterase